MGYGARGGGERTREGSSGAGGRSWWGRGSGRPRSPCHQGWGSEEEGAQERAGGAPRRNQVYLLLSSPSVNSPSHCRLHHDSHHISALPLSHCSLAPLELKLEWSCSIGVTGAEAPPLPRGLLVTCTRLFIKWAQRAWATRQLGVAGWGGAHCRSL